MPFRKALEIRAHSFPALPGLGNLPACSGEHDAAMVRPKAWGAHFLLGWALNRAGQFAKARRRAAKLVEEARELMQSGDLEGAGQRLELARVVREYAQAAWLNRYLLGLVKKGGNRLPDAKANLEAAARLNPSEAPVLNALGEVVLLQGDRAAAIAYFEKACALVPGDESFRRNLETARGARIKQ